MTAGRVLEQRSEERREGKVVPQVAKYVEKVQVGRRTFTSKQMDAQE